MPVETGIVQDNTQKWRAGREERGVRISVFEDDDEEDEDT